MCADKGCGRKSPKHRDRRLKQRLSPYIIATAKLGKFFQEIGKGNGWKRRETGLRLYKTQN